MNKENDQNAHISRRDFLVMTGATGLALSLSGCGGGNTKNRTPSSKEFKYKFPNNITDGRILIATSKTGAVITYFGDKDSQGNATNVRAVEISRNDKKDLMYYDPTIKRLVKIVTSNGVYFNIDWQDSTKAVLTLSHPETSTSLSTPLDFSTQTTASKLVTSNAVRSNIPLRPYNARASKQSVMATSSTGNCKVSVTRCGQPYTSFADVFVTVSKKGLNVTYASYPAFPIGDGNYVANIPTGNKKIVNLGEAASQALDALENVCEPFTDFKATASVQYFCTAATVAIGSVPDGINQVAAGAFLSACTTFNTLTTLGCEAISSPPGKVGTKFLSDLLEAGVLDVDVDLTDEIDLTAQIAALPSPIFGSTRTAPITGPFPSLEASLGFVTQIAGLSLDPASPVAHQPYNATAKVLCVKAGDIVTLKVTGTDGYRNQIAYGVTNAQSSGEFTLRVPGAATSGIRDTVDVYVVSKDNNQLQETRFLVFI